jgi:hypothetical protein
MYSGGIMGISDHKNMTYQKHRLKFGSVGNLIYFGVALDNKAWRMKKLRGNEFGEMHNAAS